MKRVEKTFSRFSEDDTQLKYPDFDAMWQRIEQAGAGNEPDAPLPKAEPGISRPNRLRKVVILSSLTAVLVAAPVTAAISYDWDILLRNRISGVHSAFQQGLGQTIEQSVTQDQVNLTIHTAFVDDNRTVLLYSLSMPEGQENQSLRFAEMELKDREGRVIEGRSSHVWDKQSKAYTGYFETEWTPEETTAEVQFSARNLQAFSIVEQSLAFNPFDSRKQRFEIGKDGMGQLELQPFTQGNDKLMLSSAITFTSPEAKSWAGPMVEAYKDGENLPTAEAGVYGTPGVNGEYTGQQVYKQSVLEEEGVQYKLVYAREDERVDKEWTFDLQLDKQRMASGTIKRNLNIPIEYHNGPLVLEQLIVTPTQVRLKGSREAYQHQPFLEYTLEVDGTPLRGGIWHEIGDDPKQTTFRFELPPSVRVTEETKLALVGKYEVQEHKDYKEPIHLSRISAEKQSFTKDIGGFPVVWTYYKQDGNLYVQSESPNPAFEKVNQTYMLQGKEQIPGKPTKVNFLGSGSSEAIDLYPGFEGTEADIYIFWYYTGDKDKEIRIPLNKK